MLSIEQIKKNGWLIYEAIVGSRAYGLNTANSDTDIRGVFVLPKEIFYSVEYEAQVSNDSNDIVYYELKRFFELLARNNPNIMELLNIPEDCILQKHEIMNRLNSEMFLSKLCEQTFANYAYTQIKKAYGLEKKIVNPVDKDRKSVLDFCFVHVGKETFSLQPYLAEMGFLQENIGLSVINHMKDCYNLYYDVGQKYSGVMRKENANDVSLSNIPKDAEPKGLLYFNKDGYSIYCKKYKEYWEWVEKRNEERYSTTMSHGKNYDSKNMKDVFRLLRMAREIATDKKINVSRSDREFLLKIKQGEFEYDDLVVEAEKMREGLSEIFAQADLMESPDLEKLNSLLFHMRNDYYAVAKK